MKTYKVLKPCFLLKYRDLDIFSQHWLEKRDHIALKIIFMNVLSLYRMEVLGRH